MTPDEIRHWEELMQRQERLAERLRRIGDRMKDRAVRRAAGVTVQNDALNDAIDMEAWEETLKRIEQTTDQIEQLLKEGGVLPTG